MSSYNICYQLPDNSSVVLNVVATSVQVDAENGILVLFNELETIAEFRSWLYYIKQ